VHGYAARESERLLDQAAALTELLHGDTVYPAGSAVLEVGCGVGAQTAILARRHPGVRLCSVDLDVDSLRRCRQRLAGAGLPPVPLAQADLFALPFAAGTFDHVFVCFVLEHLSDPHGALRRLRELLRPGGTLTAIEGDHGSAYFHPGSAPARRAIQCLIELQARAGGDALIGRRLYPLVASAGFDRVVVRPCVVYADGGHPLLAQGFTRSTFAAMVEGVGEQVLAAGLIDPSSWRQGVADLYRAAEPDGTFSYTFFKAVATR
jgi:SAM-dependent methyltransferase